VTVYSAVVNCVPYLAVVNCVPYLAFMYTYDEVKLINARMYTPYAYLTNTIPYFEICWCRHILATLAQMASFILVSLIFATCRYVSQHVRC